MDIITDLTAQTVSCLTIIQDMCKEDLDLTQRNELQHVYLWHLRDKLGSAINNCSPKILLAINDIIWKGNGPDDDLKNNFLKLCNNLFDWLGTYGSSNQQAMISAAGKEIKDGTLFCTPFQWRRVIRAILYDKEGSRADLTESLYYMPVQIILCLGGNSLGAEDQRLYQVWDPKNTFGNFDGKNRNDKWWTDSSIRGGAPRKDEVDGLLKNDQALLQRLKDESIAVPFETLFNDELDEICKSREERVKDNSELLGIPSLILKKGEVKDPLKRAEEMKLHGLSLSGGGIRSATFNLGVLQRLAEQGKLGRFDYMSTVSGGGYIGTWLASWIKRGGSVGKVSDRLNIKKSADPLGEEVRPIRWLRMFSNYLAPDASIMSADSWTMGITWLRNTLINQVILLLLLCTGLSLVTDIFNSWVTFSHYFNNTNWWLLGICSFLLFTPAVILAGYGMQAFDKHPETAIFKFGQNRFLSTSLVIWALVVAYVISFWMYHENAERCGFIDKARILAGVGIAGLASMIAIAYIGYYRTCARRRSQKYIDIAIIGSSLLASAAGLAALTGVWMLLQYIKLHTKDLENSYKWTFICGPPLILETFSCCVVVRMAIMGSLFPDERREWWGRVGAIVHRMMLLWILITIGALILPDKFRELSKYSSTLNIPALFGGWAAIIGGAVKLAYSSKDGTAKVGDSKASMITDLIVRVAPYIFMLGFLLLGAYTLQYVNDIAKDWEHYWRGMPTCWFITLIMTGLTLFLSWRVGVNEFSLHHFYRNRLVRAYLGATRRRTDRDRTVNNFTGFDKDDDIKLSKFRTTDTEAPYYGPYPLINTTLNATAVAELDRQDRKAESFVFTPLYCGFDFSPTRSAAYAKDQVFEYGYRPTEDYAYKKGPMIGTAMAISGAAVNPNMGYHSSPATAFMLTMFNVRLGWWIGNPRRKTWRSSDPTFGVAYLVSDLVGNSDIDSRFVCLSDGGHFDNMGLYELIRRKCTHITLCDAEEDSGATCEGLANAIRRCRIDLGVEITIDTSPITEKDAKGFSVSHMITTGTIRYPGETVASGTITYIKTTLTGDETTDIREYHMNNALFPQQPTNDQFFTEEQFESYRRLGYHSA